MAMQHQDTNERPATYTAMETARLLGIGRTSFYERIAKNDLPEGLRPIRIGNKIMFSRRAIDRLLDLDDRESA